MARGRVDGGSRGRGRGRGRGRAHHGGGSGPGAVANAQAGTEYDAGIHETREQIAGSRKREGDLGSWYRQLAADYQRASNQGSAALGSVETATAQQLAEAGQRSSADQSSLASSDAAFAKLTGGPQDTAGLTKIAQAGAAAAKGRVEMAIPIEQEQANFVGRLGADKAAARLKGIESRTEERSRRGKLKSDLSAQRREKGSARVSAKAKILEAKAAQAAEARKLALEEQEARAAERQAASDEALARVESARDARQAKISNRQENERIAISRRNAKTSERSQRNSAKADKGGLTPSERRTRREHAKNAAVEAANLYKAATKPPKDEAGWAAFVHLVAEQSEISPTDAAKAVAELRAAIAAKAKAHSRRLHEGKVPGH